MKKTKIFVFYYDENQEQNLIKGNLFVPYKNRDTNLFLENQLIYDVAKSDLIEDCEYVGFLSHKHWMVEFNKTIPDDSPFKNYSKRIINNESVSFFIEDNVADVISFNTKRGHDTFGLGNAIHPGMSKLLDLFLTRLGIPLDVNKFSHEPIYRNFFIIKKEHLIDFAENYLKKIFELTYSDKEIYELSIIEQENYHQRAPEPFVQNTGFTRYTLVLFLVERFINLYVNIKNLKVVGY